MERVNFHTHTKRCHHAYGEDEEYVQEAIAKGVTRLGFSDHAPFPDERWSFSRMDYAQLPEYCDAIRTLATRYEAQLTIELGLEIEYDQSQLAYYAHLLNEVELDYLILAQHYFRNANGEEQSSFQVTQAEDLVLYATSVVEAMETGLFGFVAHPDVMFNSYPQWDEACEQASHLILAAAQRLAMPLELNANGIRKGERAFSDEVRLPYPHPRFWELAQGYDVFVLINSDCHYVSEMYDEAVEQGYALAKQWQLQVVTQF